MGAKVSIFLSLSNIVRHMPMYTRTAHHAQEGQTRFETILQ